MLLTGVAHGPKCASSSHAFGSGQPVHDPGQGAASDGASCDSAGSGGSSILLKAGYLMKVWLPCWHTEELELKDESLHDLQ